MAHLVSTTPPRLSGEAVALLSRARLGLAEAEWEQDPVERFTAAYASAVRAGAAVLAGTGRPHRGRARPASVWVLLESAAPELAEWAHFFAAHSGLSAAAQAGVTSRITARAADDLLRQTWQFVDLVNRKLRGAAQPVRKAS